MLPAKARAVGRRLRSLAQRTQGPGNGPVISVVVVVRGGAGFLDECLASVLASSHRALDVLVVAEPENEKAQQALRSASVRARRVRRLEPTATTTWLDEAVALTTGDYLVFVDADDLLPPSALGVMVGVLEESGSDLLVGAQHLAQSGGAGAPSWTAELFQGRLLRQTTDSCPRALVDLGLTNKMFRLDSWRAAGLTLHQWDGAASTVVASYLSADRYDVIGEIVSEVHARDVSLSVGEQRRFRADVVAARLGALHEVARRLPESLRKGWLVDTFTHLLPPMYVDAVGGRASYFDVLAPAVRDLLEGLRTAEVPVQQRMTAWVVAHGTLEDLALLLDLYADNPRGLPTEHGLTSLPQGLACRPPDTLRAIEDVDRRLRSTVADLVDDSEGSLWVEGAAFVEYADDQGPLVVEVVDPAGHRRAASTVTPRVDPRVQEWAARAHEDRSDAGFVARVDLTGLDITDRLWTVQLTLGDRSVELRAPRVGPGVSQGVEAVLTGADLDGDVLRLRGLSSETRSVRLTGPRASTASVATSHDNQNQEDEWFTAVVELRTLLFDEVVRLPADRYLVELADESEALLHAAWDRVALAEPPAPSEGLSVTPVNGPRGAVLVAGTPLRVAERSAFEQQQLLSRVYAAPASSTYDSTVLLETFRGRSVGDNPGAIGRELLRRDLGLDLAWVVDDPSVSVPDGSRAVTRRTREWYDLLGRARGYVANAGAPYFFEKKPGQFHLQTWHGTPIKRIGEDRGPGDFNTWRHRRRIASQAAAWDAMVSPSGYCSAIFRTAFGYDGQFLEVGYPRNDILLGPDAAQLRARVRERLRLRDTDRAVLYAPTWRQYVGVRDAKPLYLDAELLTRELPDTVVLVRGHYNSTGQADVFAEHPRIQDVTRYPDIADLYLAADVLVTDYSSAMFDFALTDRPIVLLTPDLEQYRDVERGFYFDIETSAPGPMVESTEAVVEQLLAGADFAARRAAFRDEFCPFDDGMASCRVVDYFLHSW
jgi:CDP-glycerol glycerophosphotransferase (TagB/SpsB family)/glycosyltransferase involved in cell wall biosynthesis